MWACRPTRTSSWGAQCISNLLIHWTDKGKCRGNWDWDGGQTIKGALISQCVNFSSLWAGADSIMTLCIEAELYSQANRSMQEEGIRLSRPGLLEVMALQDSCVNPGFLLPLPRLANPNLCHNNPDRRTTPSVVFAQLRWLCVGVSNPLVPAPWLFSPSFSVWFLFFQQFVDSFVLCLALEEHVRRFQWIDSGEVKGSRWGGYLRKSCVSCCIVSQWCQHVQ